MPRKRERLQPVVFKTLLPSEVMAIASTKDIPRKKVARVCGISYEGWSRLLKEEDRICKARLEFFWRVAIEHDFNPPKFPAAEPWEYVNMAIAHGLNQKQARELSGYDKSWNGWLYGSSPKKMTQWRKERLHRIMAFMNWI